MTIELKPCPFCGGEAKVFKHKKAMASFGTLFSYEVECAYCFCRTGLYPSEEKAVNAWNRRKAPEIITCGECEYREIRGVDGFCDHITGEEIMVRKTDYCKWAERKVDG